MAGLPSPCPCDLTLPSHISRLTFRIFCLLVSWSYPISVGCSRYGRAGWLVGRQRALISTAPGDYDDHCSASTAVSEETITQSLVDPSSSAVSSAVSSMSAARARINRYQANQRQPSQARPRQSQVRSHQIGEASPAIRLDSFRVPVPSDLQKSKRREKERTKSGKRKMAEKEKHPPACACNSRIQPHLVFSNNQPSQFSTIGGRPLAGWLGCAVLGWAELCCAEPC